jgi:hypothetical protein
VALIETPGPDGRKHGVKRALVAILTFRLGDEYKTKEAFQEDFHKHHVRVRPCELHLILPSIPLLSLTLSAPPLCFEPEWTWNLLLPNWWVQRTLSTAPLTRSLGVTTR